ncbi:SIR2 family protein [Anaerolineales bacterium HSG6]|nr:SIR2 family protein [Anaerolineales bacterium HSG6]
MSSGKYKQSGDWGTLVRRIKKRKRTRGIDWRTIIRRIKTGKCTPIISYQVSGNHFSKQDQVVETWANELDYPLQDNHNLIRVAQYASVNNRDNLATKEDYLEFLKNRLVDKARDENLYDEMFLDTLEDEVYDLTFSEVAGRLGYPRYDNETDNPLRILAELPMPIYLTTNYATYLEDSLRQAGKEPRTEICFWHDNLDDEDFVSVFKEDPDYHPSVENPIVFHLHGLDAIPSSLVLTEDDYLDFLIKVAEDPDVIPRRVSQALADSSLLMLGYQLTGWDFRTIFRGLITSKRSSRRLLSLSIQYELEEEDIVNMADVQDYIKKYFTKANFDIYWGDTKTFMQELWEQWEG